MERRFLSVQEVADYLGVKTSSVYSWVHTRSIPYFKIGRLVKFDLSAIDQWLEKSAARDVIEQ
jgi:excisionase family DNA binding protein